MKRSNIAIRISGIAIIALAIWAAYRAGIRKATQNLSDVSPANNIEPDEEKERYKQETPKMDEYPSNQGDMEIPLADKIKLDAEQERYKQRAPLGLEDVGTPDASLSRYDPYDRSTGTNLVRGWPSTGGIIVAERVQAVELQFLDIDRFKATPRSSDADKEDAFCRKLRLIGAKWWPSCGDFERARLLGMRTLYPDEAEVLFLGWPEGGGVWVSRYKKIEEAGSVKGAKMLGNALSMEERCSAIEILGGSFFMNPRDSEFVRPYVDGFGTHEKRRELESYEAV